MATLALGRFELVSQSGIVVSFDYDESRNREIEEALETMPVTKAILSVLPSKVVVGFDNAIAPVGCAFPTNRGPVMIINPLRIEQSVEPRDVDVVTAGAIVHEAVHIHQQLTGRLVLTPYHVEWCGQTYLGTSDIGMHTEMPWEDEAYMKQAEFLSKMTGGKVSTEHFYRSLHTEMELSGFKK